MEHIFLTGEVGTGKSTLLRRLVEAHAWNLGGFASLWLPEQTGRALWLTPYGADPRTGWVAAREDGQGRTVFPEAFDCAARLLTAAPGTDWLIADELGIFERNSPAFQQAVLAALDGDVPMLGVIKPKHTAFLDAVRAHPAVRLYTVTPENRETLFAQLNRKLSK